MKTILLRLAACSLLVANVTHASQIEYEKVSSEPRLNRFDSSESLSEITLLFSPSAVPSAVASHYKIPAPSNDRVTSTLCASMFEVDRVAPSGLFKTKRTVFYSRTEFNASKLQGLAVATAEERAKIGLIPEDQVDLRRVELTDGSVFYTFQLGKSGYLYCGKNAEGVSQSDRKSASAVEVYIRSERLNGQPGECKPVDLRHPTLPQSEKDHSFSSGVSATSFLEQCRLTQDELKKQAELAKANEARIIQEANEAYEREKKKHKMIPGVQILANTGVESSRDLIYRCLGPGPIIGLGFNQPSTKQKWKQDKCRGYYPEEVEDLQREMRVRGMVRN